MNALAPPVRELKRQAVAANLEFLSDPVNLAGIARYVERGVFPWERE
jgi:polyketide biosynthesis enoyl-CoA hydratase PksH